LLAIKAAYPIGLLDGRSIGRPPGGACQFRKYYDWRLAGRQTWGNQVKDVFDTKPAPGHDDDTPGDISFPRDYR
jgi:hypothetical protein